MLELALGQVQPERVRSLAAQPARALAGTAAELEHPPAAHRAQHLELGLLMALWAPHETDVAQEAAVRVLVLVGVEVPVGAVGPAGRLLRDRPTNGLHAVRCGGHDAEPRAVRAPTGPRSGPDRTLIGLWLDSG